MTIEINDRKGINITSNKEINIRAADNVTINSEDGSMMLAGENAVDMIQGDASIRIKDDIHFTGAKFRIH